MMEKSETASPNHSLKANLGLSNSMMMTKSPNLLNISDHMARKMPKTTSSKHRYSFSPMPCRFDESPNVSPIKKDLKEIKSDTGTDSPSSNFLKRRDLQRDLGDHVGVGASKSQKSPSMRLSLTPNFNLETRLCVRTILKELGLSKLNSLFEDEEIDLMVFFTLDEKDLKSIGIDDEEDRKKILDFIKDFKTPEQKRKQPIRTSIRN